MSPKQNIDSPVNVDEIIRHDPRSVAVGGGHMAPPELSDGIEELVRDGLVEQVGNDAFRLKVSNSNLNDVQQMYGHVRQQLRSQGRSVA